jgi:coniferyl-aldehyde dehydrogenase
MAQAKVEQPLDRRTRPGFPMTPSAADLRRTLDALRAAQMANSAPSADERVERLDRLASAVKRNKDAIVEAVTRDFGNRSSYETRIAEVLMLLDGIKYARKHLRDWMRPQKRHVSMTYAPARAAVLLQPVGVVGVIAPWNYPVLLALAPAAAAIAAGNRVMIKPSEHTPATSELIAKICDAALGSDVVAVVTGGADVGEAFSKLPFDHLVFTGSTHVGRMVMRAAAENLVPVTLELGGKSPTIVHEDYPVDKAAARIAWGKWVNAGQTCIAPDYLLVPESRVEAYIEALAVSVRRSYPTLADNPDYTSIINDRHYQRLGALVDDAVARGARKVDINPAGEALDPAKRKLAPTLLTGVTDDMKVMQEEIFGPVLPIVSYRSLDDAIGYVARHPRPLALYYFDHDQRRVAHVLERTLSGGAAINETVLHFGIDDMPFGGVGPSGMGAYHGREGFETFSHKRGVLYQAKWNATGLLAPPYGERLDRMLKILGG